MEKKISQALKKILKVIRFFEDDVVLVHQDETVRFDDRGKILDSITEIPLKMAVMTFQSRFNVTEGTINNQDSTITRKKECYYILKDTDSFRITENSKIRYKNTVYRINSIEENYGIFLRMELEIDDRRN